MCRFFFSLQIIYSFHTTGAVRTSMNNSALQLSLMRLAAGDLIENMLRASKKAWNKSFLSYRSETLRITIAFVLPASLTFSMSPRYINGPDVQYEPPSTDQIEYSPKLLNNQLNYCFLFLLLIYTITELFSHACIYKNEHVMWMSEYQFNSGAPWPNV